MIESLVHNDDRYKYREYRKIWRMFEKEHPELLVRGISYIPFGYQEIKIYIPRKGILIYNPVGTSGLKITWIERWKDEMAEKQKERNMRPDMYQNFLREINWYQNATGSSQADIARLTGISRQSINKYLSGVNPPKVSTMRKIAESLKLDI